jgi:hypothetical protein
LETLKTGFFFQTEDCLSGSPVIHEILGDEGFKTLKAFGSWC